MIILHIFYYTIHRVLDKTWAADLYLRYDPSYEFIGEVILKINIAENIKAEVYVNQDKSLSDLQTLIKPSFLLYFPHESLMSFIIILTWPDPTLLSMRNG
jgi:hypothetical protein